MRIEKETLDLEAIHLTPSADGGSFTVISSRKSYKLNSLQYSYLDVLRNSVSIESLVQFFLGQGWLVSFRELSALLQFLVDEHLIRNPAIRIYFHEQSPQLVNENHNQTLSIDPKTLPFFRSLDPQLAQYLLQKSERVPAGAQSKIIESGKKDRDLFILLKGQAGIYKVFGPGQRKMVAHLQSGALFGERGFLLGQARAADVIALTPAQLLRVSYLPEFNQLIKSEKAQSLQQRFWILQALQSSNFFKDLPGDCLDSLIFSGRLVQAPAHQVLFHEGQSANTCYILVQGNVLISKQGKNINVLSQGSCFGEISLLMSGGVRTATAQTQQDSIFLEIHQTDFYRILAQNLFLAKEIETLAAQRILADKQRG